MDVIVKRRALKGFCDNNEECVGCPLRIPATNTTAIECDFDTAPDEMIELWFARAFPEPVFKDGSGVDHEAEYHRLLEENAKLKEENKYIRLDLEGVQDENHVLREKLNIVYLIFGGHNR